MTEPKKREGRSREDGDDRRSAPRHGAAKLGKVITRVIGGCEVKLLDFSRNGLLVASDARLAIGAKVAIRLTTTDAAVTVHGYVVRSKVAALNGAAVYHTALALEDDLAELEKGVPAAKKEPKRAPTLAVADRDDGSEHASLGDLDTGVGAPVDPILEFLATVPHDLAELRRRAAVNNW